MTDETKARYKRLYELESGWAKCGTGDVGHGRGQYRTCKRAGKLRRHYARLDKLRKLAGL